MRAALALLLFACSDLPTVERNVCGNQVLEGDELCDTFSSYGGGTACGPADGPHPCAYICMDAAGCPAGWGCGSDGRCREPVESFAAVPEQRSFRSVDLTFGDVDGDGAVDLIGNDRSQFQVLFQTSPRRFDGEFVLETRLPIGGPSIDDLDGDGRIDVVLPTTLGLLVLLGQSDQTLLSRLFDTALGLPNDAELRFVITGDRDRTVDAADVSVVAGGAIASIDAAPGAARLLPPWLDGARLPDRIPYAHVPREDERSTFALWNPGGTELALFRVEGDTPADRRPEVRWSLASLDPLTNTAELADANGDGAVDVIAGVLHTNQPIAVAFNGDAGFAPFCNLSFDSDATLLRAADFDGDLIADYVFDTAVLVSDGAIPECGVPFRSGRVAAVSLLDPWSEVELGDFNGDGRLDFAAASSERQLDVYFGSGTGGFARRTVLLDQPAARLRAGDFDGDFIDDLAFVMTEPNADRIAVVFGDAGSDLFEVRTIGRFAEVLDLAAAHWAFDLESLDLVSDLLIESRSFAGGATAVAVAYGSTSGQMFAPFVFPDSETGVPMSVVQGDFCGCGEEECARQDLIAMSRGNVPPRTELWLARGAPFAGLIPDPRRTVIPAAALSGFEIACSLWQAIDLDGDGTDEAVAVDDTAFCGAEATSQLLAIEPGGERCDRDPSIEVRALAEGAYTGATRIRARDVDADGDPDVLLVFIGRSGAGAGVLILWNDGASIPLGTRTTPLDAPPGTSPIDADLLQLDTDPTLEIALRTFDGRRTAIWFFDQTGGAWTSALFRELPIMPAAIAAGDFDRDGLDDLALAGGARVSFFWALDGAER